MIVNIAVNSSIMSVIELDTMIVFLQWSLFALPQYILHENIKMLLEFRFSALIKEMGRKRLCWPLTSWTYTAQTAAFKQALQSSVYEHQPPQRQFLLTGCHCDEHS